MRISDLEFRRVLFRSIEAVIIGHINVQSLGTLRSEVEAALKKSRQLECPIRIAWKDQLTECVIQIRTIITAIKNSLGIHRGDDLADLDVIIIRRNRQARYEARLLDHADRPATRFLRLQIGITSRSDERRVGQGWVSTCKTRWVP